MIFYLGFDDTGQPGNRGTAELALELGQYLQVRGIARLMHVSAHQLLPPAELPGSSLNQAYCLTLEAEKIKQREIDMESRVYIRRNASAGSNAGFALARSDQMTGQVLSFAKACRSLLLERHDALELARECGISSAGFTGSGNGVIGALAAIGWRWQGDDGVITWLPGLTELKGVMTMNEILHHCTLDYIKSVRGKTPLFEDRIQMGDGATALLKAGRTLLLLESAPRGKDWHWTALGSEAVSRITW